MDPFDVLVFVLCVIIFPAMILLLIFRLARKQGSSVVKIDKSRPARIHFLEAKASPIFDSQILKKGVHEFRSDGYWPQASSMKVFFNWLLGIYIEKGCVFSVQKIYLLSSENRFDFLLESDNPSFLINQFLKQLVGQGLIVIKPSEYDGDMIVPTTKLLAWFS